ncbi:beta-ketoacyl-ACP synthase [Zooshikella harenae]|uniref:Beta-ketoacyl-ACP synthase n=1 Tax=Zooshikella harenae TaxID=2827238 RepID=A0ABS5ZBL1_9GAMM|nr:beta-ketoacyl-ACP synthase [Zooshikella harenae]MBU2711268.1 beta-ketoacyl-ACP synthase [Zooshikella harenae]
MKRVVVTGMSAITSLGDSWESVLSALQAKRTGICQMPDWEKYEGLLTNLAAPVVDFTLPKHYTRKKTRSMGRVSQMATLTAERALMEADLLESEEISSGAMGIAYGSSVGSTTPMVGFGRMLSDHTTQGITGTSYIQMMTHTAAVNMGLFFGIKGRLIPTSSACTSGSQGLGFAYETIKYGLQPLMLAGGAEELCPTEAAIFDTLYATSTQNSTPHLSPRPFDKDRDGLVIGEGACTFVLEELEHAQRRGANIIAEVIGFATNTDGAHVTQPHAAQMAEAMRIALKDAGLNPSDIDYLCAHGTATTRGDIAESQATYDVFGDDIPISSLKSYFGHTLGACGAIEAWLSINMMQEAWFAPTVNLVNPDPECAPLNYIMNDGIVRHCQYVMSNNFAFGGINTSLIFKRWLGE